MTDEGERKVTIPKRDAEYIARHIAPGELPWLEAAG
jgi:hypothetical protein